MNLEMHESLGETFPPFPGKVPALVKTRKCSTEQKELRLQQKLVPSRCEARRWLIKGN